MAYSLRGEGRMLATQGRTIDYPVTWAGHDPRSESFSRPWRKIPIRHQISPREDMGGVQTLRFFRYGSQKIASEMALSLSAPNNTATR